MNKAIQKLRDTNSTKDKVEIIKELYLEGEEFANVLQATYNPYIVYGVKFKTGSISDNIGSIEPEGFSLLAELSLKSFRTTAEIKVAIEAYSEVYGDLIKLIVNKDLRCGISVTTINKAIPGLLPSFKVQLAKELKRPAFPCLAQLKYDGVRIIILWDGSEVVFKTRNGKLPVLPQMSEHLLTRFKELNAEPCIIDTEVTLRDGGTTDRTTVSGMINSAMHGGDINEQDLVFNAFDIMPYLDFQYQKCVTAYTIRLSMLTEFVLNNKFSPYVLLAKTYEIKNKLELESLFRDTLASGQEGLIVKYPQHFYKFTRTAEWGKMKAVLSTELDCIGIVEGQGKFEGQIGSLKCTGWVLGRSVSVNVGSGLTDVQRSLPASSYIGHSIEVRYNDVIEDSTTGQWSLFLPRFVEVRIDK